MEQQPQTVSPAHSSLVSLAMKASRRGTSARRRGSRMSLVPLLPLSPQSLNINADLFLSNDVMGYQERKCEVGCRCTFVSAVTTLFFDLIPLIRIRYGVFPFIPNRWFGIGFLVYYCCCSPFLYQVRLRIVPSEDYPSCFAAVCCAVIEALTKL